MSILRVFITVDTEAWPMAASKDSLVPADFDRDYYGRTSEGEFGTVYQADLLRKNDLRGVFFVEALSSYVSGLDPLRTLVEKIVDRGHEVGLHTHPEWCRRCPSLVGPSSGDLMRDYSEDDQARLIAKGLDQLRACGVSNIRSFRAGGYGGNFTTLKALARNQVAFDSSHNACWMGRTCDMRTAEPLLQPTLINGVCEYPVTCFEDWPGHSRHAEICACSSGELEHLLLQADRKGWHSVVIVSHSFELIRRNVQRPTPNWVVVRRFEKLCQFLATNRDKFRTSTFHDEGLDRPPFNTIATPLEGRVHKTVWRQVEQAWKRVV